MTLRTDKDLKSKNFRGKKVYILAKEIDSKRKFEIKAKKFRIIKIPFFEGHPNSGISKRLYSSTKKFLFT